MPQENCWTDTAWKADDTLFTADLVAYQQPKTWKYGKMRPGHFGKRNLCIYISKAIICFFSKYNLKQPLVKEEEAWGAARNEMWEFSAASPWFPGCSLVSGANITQVTDFQCRHYPAIPAVSQVAKWQWGVSIFKVSLASVLHPYCKTFDSIDSCLNNFPLQKKKLCYQQSALPCTFSWERRDAWANAWADVKALLKKWVLMRIWFQFWDK